MRKTPTAVTWSERLKIRFLWYYSLSEQINHILKSPFIVTPNWSLKCRLPNRISFDVFRRCFCKVETTACETLRSSAQRLDGLAVTSLPGVSRSINPAVVSVRTYFAVLYDAAVTLFVAACFNVCLRVCFFKVTSNQNKIPFKPWRHWNCIEVSIDEHWAAVGLALQQKPVAITQGRSTNKKGVGTHPKK